MARPRKYADDNERAAAYRARLSERTIRVDRQAAEELLAAVEAAAAAGDRDAEMVRGGGLESTLRNLALWFRRRAETAGADDR